MIWVILPFAIIGLVVLVALGYLVWRQRSGAVVDGYRALAARRGWTFSLGPETLEEARPVRLSNPSSPGFSVSLDLDPADPVADFQSQDKTWPQGWLILHHPPVPDTDLDAHRLLTGLGLALDPAELVPQTGPETLSIAATTPPGRRFDIDDLAQVLGTLVSQVGAQKTALIIGPEGTTLRLHAPLRQAHEVELFIDQALAVLRKIG